MTKVNTHGLFLKGIRVASGNTCVYGFNDGRYNELFYDLSTGEVWTVFHSSLGQNSWTDYHDNDTLKICNTTSHMSMQEIADRIYNELKMAGRYDDAIKIERR